MIKTQKPVRDHFFQVSILRVTVHSYCFHEGLYSVGRWRRTYPILHGFSSACRIISIRNCFLWTYRLSQPITVVADLLCRDTNMIRYCFFGSESCAS